MLRVRVNARLGLEVTAIYDWQIPQVSSTTSLNVLQLVYLMFTDFTRPAANFLERSENKADASSPERARRYDRANAPPPTRDPSGLCDGEVHCRRPPSFPIFSIPDMHSHTRQSCLAPKRMDDRQKNYAQKVRALGLHRRAGPGAVAGTAVP